MTWKEIQSRAKEILRDEPLCDCPNHVECPGERDHAIVRLHGEIAALKALQNFPNFPTKKEEALQEEIERLRAEKDYKASEVLLARAEKAESEVTGLKKVLQDLIYYPDVGEDELDSALAEVMTASPLAKRLLQRARKAETDIKILQGQLEGTMPSQSAGAWKKLEAERDRLAARNKKLREALVLISLDCPSDWIIHKALAEDKP